MVSRGPVGVECRQDERNYCWKYHPAREAMWVERDIQQSGNIVFERFQSMTVIICLMPEREQRTSARSHQKNARHLAERYRIKSAHFATFL